MIILPVVILLIEIGYAKSFKKPTQFSKYFVNMAIFIFTIIVIGSLANGANFKAYIRLDVQTGGYGSRSF